MSTSEPAPPYRPRWLARPKGYQGVVYQFVVVWPGDILGLFDSAVGAVTCGFIRPDLSMKWMFRGALWHSRWMRSHPRRSAPTAPSAADAAGRAAKAKGGESPVEVIDSPTA